MNVTGLKCADIVDAMGVERLHRHLDGRWHQAAAAAAEFADSSGAVVIPGVQIEQVLAEARRVEAADAASRELIAREQARDAVTRPQPIGSRERRSS